MASSSKTPLFNKGKICPGRAKSCGLVAESTKDNTVAARSAADIPVVTPF
jgi:hypothetical protein